MISHVNSHVNIESDVDECNGVENVMCRKCWKVFDHKCNCSPDRVTRCRCVVPDAVLVPSFETRLPVNAHPSTHITSEE